MRLHNYLDNTPKYSDMEYYFTPGGQSYKHHKVYKNGVYIGIYSEDDYKLVMRSASATDRDSDMAVHASFLLFMKRVEYAALQPVLSMPTELEDLQLVYELTLVGVYLQRCFLKTKEDPDSQIRNIMHAIEWLRSCNFYECPASTKYHEAFPGGLVLHSLRVVEMTKQLSYMPAFADKVELHSAVLCALVHDWCKIGMYESFMRNVKDDNGNWTQVQSYKTSGKFVIPAGHGVSSYFLASRFFRLTPEEVLAIRWHMGKWRVADDEVNELQTSNENFPLVHLIQFADQLSITNYAFSNQSEEP